MLHILHDYLTNGEVGEGVSQGGWLLMASVGEPVMYDKLAITSASNR